MLGRGRGLLDFLEGLPHLRHPIMKLMCVERVDNEFSLVATTNGTAVVAIGRGGCLLQGGRHASQVDKGDADDESQAEPN